MPDPIGFIPPPAGVIPNFDHPKDAFQTLSLVLNIICLIAVNLILLLRLYTRVFIQHTTNREDWACLLSWITFNPYVTANLVMAHFGGGYHLWEVTEPVYKRFMTAEYAGAVTYTVTICAIKITLLLIFTRVFAPYRKVVIITYVLIAIIIGFYTPMLFIKITMCKPIAGFWDASLHATCINESKLFMADTVMSVLSDMAVLALPLPVVWKLKLSVRKRIKILCLLGAGAVAASTTVVRLMLIVLEKSPNDLTYLILRTSTLGALEAAIGLICASLPATNTLFATIKRRRAMAVAIDRDLIMQSEMTRQSGDLHSPPKSKRNIFGISISFNSGLEGRHITAGNDEKRTVDVESGLTKSFAAVEIEVQDEAGFESGTKNMTLNIRRADVDIWSGTNGSHETARCEPLPILPPVEGSSNITIPQEIREIAELRVDFNNKISL